MNKIEYSKIVWGITAMALIFAAILLVPKAGKALVHAYQALAQQTSAPVLDGIDPPEGYPGTPINLYGSGFTVGNTVNFGDVPLDNVQSSDGTSLTIIAPTTVRAGRTYQISIRNGRGTSNARPYNLLCDGGDCSGDDGGDDGGNATSTPPGGPYTGPIYLCQGGFNCIEGFKVPWGGIADLQRVTLDGRYSTTTTSWAFDQIPPGIHTLSVSVPTTWFSGYTICINSVNCHGDLPIQGDSVSINFLTNNRPPFLDSNGLLNVPAGSYVDLYWHFSQNFADFGSAPPGLNSGGNVTSTSTITRSQVDSYTAGGAANVSQGSDYLQNLAQATAQTAVNALGCDMAHILTPAIRGTIVGDQSLLRNPQPQRVGGGGGASIIINDIGSTGPLRQLLPYIAGNTLQNANDIRYTRAANIGFPNQPSWDAVTYCLQNAMIGYIQQSTLNWMNTAFNGNPAFVQNLSQFLLGIQNQQAIAYFKQLQRLNPGSPIQLAVYQAAVQNYNQTYANRGLYTLNQYSSDPVAFTDGDWNQGGFTAFIHAFDEGNFLPQAVYLANEELGNETSYAADLERTKYVANQGTLDVTSCSTNDNSPLSQDCKTQVPGRITNSNYDANAYLAQQRVSINAGSYGDTIQKLVNQFIQTAPGQLFKSAAGQI